MTINEILKLKEIDQLDSAILQFSKNTLATKKLCASLLIAIISIILKLTENSLDFSIYIGSIIILIVFWLIDSTSYYYQRKLRIKMSKIVNKLSDNNFITGYGMPIKEEEKPSIIKSVFNHSQLFYYLVMLVFIITGVIDIIGWI